HGHHRATRHYERLDNGGGCPSETAAVVFALERARLTSKAGPWTPEEAVVEHPGSLCVSFIAMHKQHQRCRLSGGARWPRRAVPCFLGGVCQTPTYLSGASKEDTKEIFRGQMGAFKDEGVDFILCEYFEHVEEAEWAIEVGLETGLAPMCIGPQGDMHGNSAGDCAIRMARAGAKIVGVNCHYDPFVSLEAIKLMKEALERENLKGLPDPLAYMTPDAGKQGFIDLPEFPFALESRICNRWDMHRYAREAYDLGVPLIGGCCGFEPYQSAPSQRSSPPSGGDSQPALRSTLSGGGGLKMHTKPWPGPNREYWENLNPASGRPYSSSAMSKPDNWGVTRGNEMLVQHARTMTTTEEEGIWSGGIKGKAEDGLLAASRSSRTKSRLATVRQAMRPTSNEDIRAAHGGSGDRLRRYCTAVSRIGAELTGNRSRYHQVRIELAATIVQQGAAEWRGRGVDDCRRSASRVSGCPTEHEPRFASCSELDSASLWRIKQREGPAEPVGRQLRPATAAVTAEQDSTRPPKPNRARLLAGREKQLLHLRPDVRRHWCWDPSCQPGHQLTEPPRQRTPQWCSAPLPGGFAALRRLAREALLHRLRGTPSQRGPLVGQDTSNERLFVKRAAKQNQTEFLGSDDSGNEDYHLVGAGETRRRRPRTALWFHRTTLSGAESPLLAVINAAARTETPAIFLQRRRQAERTRASGLRAARVVEGRLFSRLVTPARRRCNASSGVARAATAEGRGFTVLPSDSVQQQQHRRTHRRARGSASGMQLLTVTGGASAAHISGPHSATRILTAATKSAPARKRQLAETPTSRSRVRHPPLLKQPESKPAATDEGAEDSYSGSSCRSCLEMVTAQRRSGSGPAARRPGLKMAMADFTRKIEDNEGTEISTFSFLGEKTTAPDEEEEVGQDSAADVGAPAFGAPIDLSRESLRQAAKQLPDQHKKKYKNMTPLNRMRRAVKTVNLLIKACTTK
uniref:Hcy-binding domain-containing protein n=1 Tax=Macrostomum lignano TaxID=282301 RepID=A0A1I8FD41_9PLAT